MSGHAVVEPTVYRVGLTLGIDAVEGVVFDLPGCHATAPGEAALCAVLPVVIAEHIAWLDQHGDVTRDAFPFEVEVAERVHAAALTDIAEGEFCFEDDLRPATREDVEAAVRRMGYARNDLLAQVRHLPDQVLDWQPPASAVTQDDWAPGVRSIRGILEHIAGADGYYTGNVGSATRPASGGQDANLFESRQRAIERLRALPESDLGTVYERRQPWQMAGYERWTVRKALRRIISHERFHTREIEQRLAWLLVGAPELADARLKVGP